MTAADTATPAPAQAMGAVRTLSASDMPLLRAHLLRLDPESRRLRFNGVVDDDFIVRYAGTCCNAGVIVIGYVEDGEVHAAAELHGPERTADSIPETAFSVEPHLRRKGVGSALFKRLLTEAKRAGYTRLRVTTGAQNEAMRALANKFGAHLTFSQGELSGTIDLGAVEPARLGLDPVEVGRTMTRAMVGLNFAFWNPILRMYGVAPSPRPQERV